MVSNVQKRISKLELTVRLLEEHLIIHGHQIKSYPLKFINSQISAFKRELQIRKDYPTYR